jgi:excinuclease ABC subunit C
MDGPGGHNGGMEAALSAVIARLPLTPGVYRFRDAGGRVLYLGRATVLRRRVASYWSGLRDRRHLAPMVARVARVEAVACDSVHEAAWLERNLLTTSLPPWNRTAGGQEHPVYIRLDPRPARPGLSVAYVLPDAALTAGAGAVYFGPYLGARRVRQAVKGLGRVLPLAYTGTGLRGTGLDIARARGLAAADRGYCAATIGAVLRREPEAVGAVRACLEEQRDRAARVLAFELAGEITGELRALEWVTSPQRASSMDGANFTASGWSGGVLTSFVVRRGQVSEWIQSACPQDSAATRVAATPAGWADFTRRNAELAAALASRAGSAHAAAG